MTGSPDEVSGAMLFVVRATMVLSTVAWAMGEVWMSRPPSPHRWARIAWTAGIALALVHAGLAFESVYGWSHEVAARATLRQAEDRLGAGWSGGIYVNYVFLATWLADAGWWWVAPVSHATRPRAIAAARRAFFVFMFVNGSVIFASGISRFVGAMCVLAVLIGAFARSGAGVRGADAAARRA